MATADDAVDALRRLGSDFEIEDNTTHREVTVEALVAMANRCDALAARIAVLEAAQGGVLTTAPGFFLHG